MGQDFQIPTAYLMETRGFLAHLGLFVNLFYREDVVTWRAVLS